MAAAPLVCLDVECLQVVNLGGEHVASPFDWLIRGVAGEFYFCKPDVFEATYEPADEVR